MIRAMGKAAGVVVLTAVVSAHVGSPDVFFRGNAGPYDVRVIVRPPEVVPGIARVTVHAPADVQRVDIRPVFWRAGSRGAPSPDQMKRGAQNTFEGSLWLMARGAYSVAVIADGARGKGTVLVPVASVARGRLGLNPALGVLLVALGIVLVAGLVNIVHKGAGESLLEPSAEMDPIRRTRARRAALIAVPVLAFALFGGARWWTAVDAGYERTIYRPARIAISLDSGVLRMNVARILVQSSGRRFPLLPDHDKWMHLFLVRADDARAFAHLHPALSSDSATLSAQLPALSEGTYHAFGDVVDETGFERTVVGSIAVPDSSNAALRARHASDPDDSWFVGDASRETTTRLADGSTMTLEIVPNGLITTGREETLRISVRDPSGTPAALEPYLGMTAHAVVVRVDGSVFVHLHPMGTITVAAQQAFVARDRGDTTQEGRLRIAPEHTMMAAARAGPVEFPYAFPKSGSYRLFMQVKRNGRVLTGAYAITVAETAEAR